MLLLLPALLLAGCGKTPVNGELDGQWIMTGMYSKSAPADEAYAEDRGGENLPVVWNVSRSLLEIVSPNRAHNLKTDRTVCRFVCSGGRLAVTQAYVHFRDRDSLVSDPDTRIFETVGIRGNAAEFRIVRLTSSRMTLCSQLDSLVFVKKH